MLPEVPGLFQYYQDWGLISGDEVDGGFVPTFKGGLVFDTRDNRPNPMKGMWTEAVVEASPKILGAESSFANAESDPTTVFHAGSPQSCLWYTGWPTRPPSQATYLSITRHR